MAGGVPIREVCRVNEHERHMTKVLFSLITICILSESSLLLTLTHARQKTDSSMHLYIAQYTCSFASMYTCSPN